MNRFVSFILTFTLPAAVFASDFVHTTDTLSQGRMHLAATTVGNKAIFAGGCNSIYALGGTIYDTADIYNGDTDSWSTAPLSQARYYLAAAAAGNKAIFAGGFAAEGCYIPSNVVDIYDATTGLWSTATLSQARGMLSAAAVGSKAVFGGGFAGDNLSVPSNVVDIYDVDTDSWSTATLSQARGMLSATTVGNKAIFAGGHTLGDFVVPSDVVDIYDADADSWSTATLSQARCTLAATAVAGKAIFAGGSKTDVDYGYNTVDIYDAETDSWSTATLSLQRGNLAATTIGNKALFAGGVVDFVPATNVVDIYDAGTGLWSTAALSEIRGFLSATVVGRKAIFAGGAADVFFPASDIVDIYELIATEVVPDVVGMTEPNAQSVITDANLAVGAVSYLHSDTVAAGDVISQDPAAGTSVRPGSLVNLVVSLGPVPTVLVPDVVGMTESNAQSVITDANLVVGAVRYQHSGTVAAGSVIIQDPAAGTSVPVGTLVDLVVSLGPPRTVVPDVVGMTEANAQSAITDANLAVGAVRHQHSDTVAAGDVITQDPGAGTSVVVGTLVNLVVSLGPVPTAAVPDVVGMTEANAQSAITDVNLAVGAVRHQHSETVAAGYVISQDPGAGTSVPLGSLVNLVVSLGPVPTVLVPDVVGMTEPNAESAITDVNLAVGLVDYQRSGPVAAGDVISQDPAAGTSLTVGSSVDFVVSLGPEMVFYVDGDAGGAGDGSSWADAYNYLQDALAAAAGGAEIRVAQGLYKPDQGSNDPSGTGDRYATFQLIDGVTIEGGYAGFGRPDPNAHDPNLYETILSGDLDGNDVDVNEPCDLPNEPTRYENSYHVVTGSGTDETTVLDGFIICSGNANGPYPATGGGGLRSYSGSPTVSNCKFTGNSAERGGGAYHRRSNATLSDCSFSNNFARHGAGMHASGKPTLLNCLFLRNSAKFHGGGICVRSGGKPTLDHCTFTHNSAKYGGGIDGDVSGATLTHCTFLENVASDKGGAAYNTESYHTFVFCTFIKNAAARGGAIYHCCAEISLNGCQFILNSAEDRGAVYIGHDAIVTNCTFVGNSTGADGGGMYVSTNRATVTNCTISHNLAGGHGGGICWKYWAGTLSNCILWANWDIDGTDESAQIHGDSHVLNYSCVQSWSGALGGIGNTDADPCFVEAGYWDPNGTPGERAGAE
ncbi:MAG: PASTA domain-containing protein [Planctomycetota bacterium]|jgi:predicted outer membrane repeat protein